jgi:transcription-repair coupling factor (superfamily II helicase)
MACSTDGELSVAGTGKGYEALCRRLARATGTAPRSIDTWEAALDAAPGTLLKLACDLEQGFVDEAQNIA